MPNTEFILVGKGAIYTPQPIEADSFTVVFHRENDSRINGSMFKRRCLAGG